MPFLDATTASVDGFLLQLLAFALRATVILAGAWAATVLLRRASAATRHMIWTSAIAGVLALPLLSVALPAWNVPLISIAARVDVPDTAPVAPAQSAPRAAPVVESTAAVAVPASAAPEPSRRAATSPGVLERLQALSVRSVLLGLWLTLALLLLARLAVATTRLSSWKVSSRPIEDSSWLALVRRLARTYGIERPVVLLENSLTDVPVTWGIVYPVILLPANSDEWDEEQRVAVLTHELAHVKRFDALSQLLGQLALALLWFHPLVWMAVRRMRLEREHACDDFVLVAGARASRYADDLLGLARRLSRPTAPAAAALAMARRSELEGRLLAILDPGMKRTAIRRAKVVFSTLTVILLAMPLAAFRPAARVTVQEATITLAPVSQPVAAPSVLADQAPAPEMPVAAPDAGASVESTAAVRESIVAAMQLPRIAGLDRPWPHDVTLKQLSTQLASISEVATAQASQGAPRSDTIDVETLIDIARATKVMKSDYDKGLMLADIAKRYRPNDALRDAYLDVVFSMSSDYERGNALVALLSRDSLPMASTARVLASAKLMSSDASRATVLKRINPAAFADSLVQKAYLDVIVAMSSNTERANAISSLVRQRPLTQAIQLGLIRAIGVISGSADKANVLLLFLEHQGIADATVRRAYIKAAESLSSDYEYRRVMAAVLR